MGGAGGVGYLVTWILDDWWSARSLFAASYDPSLVHFTLISRFDIWRLILAQLDVGLFGPCHIHCHSLTCLGVLSETFLPFSLH
jgi:hypothetical protein